MDNERYRESSFIAQTATFGGLLGLSGAVTSGDARGHFVIGHGSTDSGTVSRVCGDCIGLR